MIDSQLLLGVLAGVVVLLVLILRFKIPAFIALLIASITAGLSCGLSGAAMMKTIQNGMASTLGFVATVVGLGAMFGAILEKSGGAKAIANHLLKLFGKQNAPLSMVISGFVIAIPVFFDVAFILLVPVIYALQKSTRKSLLYYAIPLLAGLAITHSFIPPTPGPVAVADILKADLGWVMLIGALVGIPTMILSGLVFGKYIGGKIMIKAPAQSLNEDTEQLPKVGQVFAIIAIPIVLIVGNTFVSSGLLPLDYFIEDAAILLQIKDVIAFIGHPFTALILANLVAWYVLGINAGYTSQELLKVSSKSFEAAGTIILLTGAGGVFKQVLVDTKAGSMIANSLVAIDLPLIVFAFLSAAVVRLLQGSATVAMITTAGLVAPLLAEVQIANSQLACLVIAIASGASIMSHVNDSGFWLVKEYLGLSEKQTFQSWSIMTTILALTGFIFATIFYFIF